jgi:Secretion system C-terminal sorting domain
MKKKFYNYITTLVLFILLLNGNTANARPVSQVSNTTCPTSNDLYYYFEPILNTSGVLTGFRVKVCKKIAYSSCPITVVLSLQGISTSGTNTTTNVTVVIPANATCGSVDVSTYLQIQCINYVSIVCSCGSCLTPADISYWVDAFEDGNGGIMFYQLHACKIPLFNSCDVTVYFTVSGIDGTGQPVTVSMSAWISKTQSCGLKKFGHTWLEVTSVEITNVVCSNCTFSASAVDEPLTESINKSETSVPTKPTSSFIYPNPAKDEFTIRYYSDKKSKVEVIISESNGKVVSSKTESIVSGVNLIRQNAAFYKPGVYFVRIYSEFKLKHTYKLVVN